MTDVAIHYLEELRQSNPSRQELMSMWEAGWAKIFSTLAALKPGDVLHTVTIRGQPHTALQALNRALAHYAQHRPDSFLG